MKRLAIAAALLLSACTTTPRTSTYADSIYRVAHIAGEEAVRLGKLSPERFAALDDRAQAVLAGIYLGEATVQQLIAITKEMKAR